MEEEYLLKCSRCFSHNEDIKVKYVDFDGNLFCERCAAYLRKVGGYDLSPFDPQEFLRKNSKY